MFLGVTLEKKYTVHRRTRHRLEACASGRDTTGKVLNIGVVRDLHTTQGLMK